MSWPLWPKSRVKYHNTPQGILTESGIWYKTTVDLLNDYASELFEREPLELHLAFSDAWLRSPHTLSLWIMALGIMYLDPWQIALSVLLFFPAWQIIAPSLVSRNFTPILKIFDAVLLQAILYATTMSLLAMSGQYDALVIGLIGFVIFRWGVLTYLMRPVVSRCWKIMYTLPVPDHILRSYIIRGALRHGITLKDFESIEQSIVENIINKKSFKGGK